MRRVAKGTELQMPGVDGPYIRLSRGSNMVQMCQRYQGTIGGVSQPILWRFYGVNKLKSNCFESRQF